ncbi:MAG: Rrf2 family transcriptional regulator [Sumerlaeia bacterium]
MLTRTSEIAIRSLIYLGLCQDQEPVSPRTVADAIGESPTYMAKVAGMLTRAHILRAHRGANGGVTLARRPEDITILNIVEACQGLLVGNYCESISEHPEPVCSFHQAMVEVHSATVAVLKRWTLARLMERPGPHPELGKEITCRIALGWMVEEGHACHCQPVNGSGPKHGDN